MIRWFSATYKYWAAGPRGEKAMPKGRLSPAAKIEVAPSVQVRDGRSTRIRLA